MSNRAAITIRLNLEEQAAMRDLMAGYKRSPKDILKMGFYLLIETTKKIRQEKEAAEAAAKEATPSVES
jgi:hypothetical protein